MKKDRVIILLQKLINSQSWKLGKAYDYLGEKDYNDVWEAMIYAKDLIKEKETK